MCYEGMSYAKCFALYIQNMYVITVLNVLGLVFSVVQHMFTLEHDIL